MRTIIDATKPHEPLCFQKWKTWTSIVGPLLLSKKKTIDSAFDYPGAKQMSSVIMRLRVVLTHDLVVDAFETIALLGPNPKLSVNRYLRKDDVKYDQENFYVNDSLRMYFL